jgi:hypothetical protein
MLVIMGLEAKRLGLDLGPGLEYQVWSVPSQTSARTTVVLSDRSLMCLRQTGYRTITSTSVTREMPPTTRPTIAPVCHRMKGGGPAVEVAEIACESIVDDSGEVGASDRVF